MQLYIHTRIISFSSSAFLLPPFLLDLEEYFTITGSFFSSTRAAVDFSISLTGVDEMGTISGRGGFQGCVDLQHDHDQRYNFFLQAVQQLTYQAEKMCYSTANNMDH